eukprot:tig00000545_g1997.t1
MTVYEAGAPVAGCFHVRVPVVSPKGGLSKSVSWRSAGAPGLGAPGAVAAADVEYVASPRPVLGSGSARLAPPAADCAPAALELDCRGTTSTTAPGGKPVAVYEFCPVPDVDGGTTAVCCPFTMMA